MFVVYGLIDPRDSSVFYVGITDDVYTRFLAHLKCDGSNPVKDARIQELKAANRMVVMQTLQEVEGLDLAKRREAYWLRHYYDLGMSLTNLVMPVYHENIVIVQAPQPPAAETTPPEPAPKLKARMTLDEQKEYILYLLDQGYSRRRIHAKIDGYIHYDVMKSVIDECMTRPALVATKEREVPEVWKARILAELEKGKNRTEVQDELGLSGDQWWMVKTVADEYNARRRG